MKKEILKNVLLSSGEKKDYGTPPDKFGFLDSLFDFTIDLCAVPENAKLKKFYSPEDDAFTKKWKGVCFLNPPYGNPEQRCKPKCKKKKCEERGHHAEEYVAGLIDWIGKANEDSVRYGSTVVCLVPARTDTNWFQIGWDNAQAVCLVRERWQFVGAKDPSPFPLALIVFSPVKLEPKTLAGLARIGNVIGTQKRGFHAFKGKRK